MELDADAVAVAAGVLAVGEAPHVVHPQDSKDVVKTDGGLHIGLVAHGLAQGIGGEEE